MIMINFVPPLASVLGQLHLLHHHPSLSNLSLWTRQAARPGGAGGRRPGPGRPARRPGVGRRPAHEGSALA